jgi:membrane protein DedA with SNARE-associated domain
MLPGLATVFILLQQYGYAFLFPIAALEGPIITIIAALLASQGFFNIYIVYVVVVLSDLVGDLMYYALGRWGKRLLLRWGKYIKVDKKRLSDLEESFKTNGGKTLIFGKLTHSAGFVILIAAGAASMPLLKFLWYNLLATLPKALLFVLIGYFIGIQYMVLNSYIEKASLIAFVLVCFVGYYMYIRSRWAKEKKSS